MIVAPLYLSFIEDKREVKIRHKFRSSWTFTWPTNSSISKNCQLERAEKSIRGIRKNLSALKVIKLDSHDVSACYRTWLSLVSIKKSLRVIGLDRLWMTKVNLQKSSKWLEADDHPDPGYHRTFLSLDDKGDFDSLWIGRVRTNICCLHVSSELLSLDDEGETKVVSINGLACLWLTKVADGHDWSPRVIRLAISG